MSSDFELSDNERERYLRQILIFGSEGQESLKKSHVFIAGCGGLGSPIALYLAAAGVGTLTIVDQDVVVLSNLNRQLLHWSDDIGRVKVSSGEEKLRSLNPEISIRATHASITSESVPVLAKDADIIVDAVDSMETRMILNSYSVRYKIPFVHGAVHGLKGQMMVVIPYSTACLRCFIHHPLRYPVVPVLGVTAGIIGLMEANEVIKIITGFGTVPAGRLILWDGEHARLENLQVRRDPLCPVCGRSESSE
ncbi:MAG TPA: HesA/MoeB/ThiF family protein [Methanospirillum sp.]|uniref:HesA/MoeB/ThiF family protein n=1 Tax=Methanospirillum sp. TaxID=45200 RepID=UPI002D0FB733|nr:HesA/MoeB/ThiF family protein [Methanospirillum sp.]HWQ64187.1 HesA/MoeB/ThiF family protein [Methanospirillum sp.]